MLDRLLGSADVLVQNPRAGALVVLGSVTDRPVEHAPLTMRASNEAVRRPRVSDPPGGGRSRAHGLRRR
ncbi:hypothetical protein GCM10009854_32860 [Saccharopolyspora halophila]|uniref:Uncharacterized protein n=1 Tax=Saccharopolyspora halophila TaxID=405551 RepID=A0ABN3GIB3_9PSEU